MHHITYGISSLLRSVNLFLFTLLLVHLIPRASTHHGHHLRSHHLSLPRSFTPDLKLIRFTNPFFHSLSRSVSTILSLSPYCRQSRHSDDVGHYFKHSTCRPISYALTSASFATNELPTKTHMTVIWPFDAQPWDENKWDREKWRGTEREIQTVLMSESRTLTANAVPQANGWVMYNSVSGSSSSSWSRNCTFVSLPVQCTSCHIAQ